MSSFQLQTALRVQLTDDGVLLQESLSLCLTENQKCFVSQMHLSIMNVYLMLKILPTFRISFSSGLLLFIMHFPVFTISSTASLCLIKSMAKH